MACFALVSGEVLVARPTPDDAPVTRTTRLDAFVMGTSDRPWPHGMRFVGLFSKSIGKDVQDHLLAVLS